MSSYKNGGGSLCGVNHKSIKTEKPASLSYLGSAASKIDPNGQTIKVLGRKIEGPPSQSANKP
jgi:hypothetical protein